MFIYHIWQTFLSGSCHVSHYYVTCKACSTASTCNYYTFFWETARDSWHFSAGLSVPHLTFFFNRLHLCILFLRVCCFTYTHVCINSSTICRCHFHSSVDCTHLPTSESSLNDWNNESHSSWSLSVEKSMLEPFNWLATPQFPNKPCPTSQQQGQYCLNNASQKCDLTHCLWYFQADTNS